MFSSYEPILPTHNRMVEQRTTSWAGLAAAGACGFLVVVALAMPSQAPVYQNLNAAAMTTTSQSVGAAYGATIHNPVAPYRTFPSQPEGPYEAAPAANFIPAMQRLTTAPQNMWQTGSALLFAGAALAMAGALSLWRSAQTSAQSLEVDLPTYFAATGKSGKIKTRKSAAKRYKVTGTGKLMKKRQGKGHMLEKKDSNRKRDLGKTGVVSKADEASQKAMIPYA